MSKAHARKGVVSHDAHSAAAAAFSFAEPDNAC